MAHMKTRIASLRLAENLLLGPPEEEWPKNLMQPLDDQQLFLTETGVSWVAVKELKLSYHNGYI